MFKIGQKVIFYQATREKYGSTTVSFVEAMEKFIGEKGVIMALPPLNHMHYSLDFYSVMFQNDFSWYIYKGDLTPLRKEKLERILKDV